MILFSYRETIFYLHWKTVKMKKSNRYQVNSSNIIHETIDNEVVIVDLEKGYYFSLRSSAAEIWTCILAGLSVDLIVNNLSRHYGIENSQLEGSVNEFINELSKENIISPAFSGIDSEDVKNLEPHNPENAKFEEYSNPVLEKFTDMAELLLLDPIHEVDETGWPNIAPDPND